MAKWYLLLKTVYRKKWMFINGHEWLSGWYGTKPVTGEGAWFDVYFPPKCGY